MGAGYFEQSKEQKQKSYTAHRHGRAGGWRTSNISEPLLIRSSSLPRTVPSSSPTTLSRRESRTRRTGGPHIINMSLAEASEARKARLIALRKRKAGEAVDETTYVTALSTVPTY